MPIGAPFIERKYIVAMRFEAVNGTAEVTPLTGDTQLILFNASYDLQIDKIEQMVATGGYTELEALIGSTLLEFKFSHDMRLNLATGPTGIPQLDRVMQGSGLAAADATGLRSYTPDPDQDIGKTLTIWIFILNPDQSPLAVILKGAKANTTYKFAPGKPITTESTIKGVLTFADVWMDDVPDYQPDPGTLTAPVILSGVMTADGNALSIAEMTLDPGNSIVAIEDGSDAGGYAYCHIDNRVPKITLKVRADLQGGVEPFLTALQTRGTRPAIAIETQTVVATVVSVDHDCKFTLAVPAFNIKTVKKDKMGNDLAWSVDGTPQQNSAIGDEFTLAESFTLSS